MRVGTLGGGQLCMMLAEAGKNIGVEMIALVDSEDCPSRQVAELIIGDQNNAADVKNFLADIDVLTFEFENVNFEHLADSPAPIYPNVAALKIAQDRELEKQAFVACGIPTTTYKIVDSAAALDQAIKTIGLPCVIKTCRDGYDGKGQQVLRAAKDAQAVWQDLGAKRLIVENLVPFEREVSLIAVRSRSGEIAFYPLTENQHQDGILRISKAPYNDPALQASAEGYVTTLLKHLNYVGVLAVEFFVAHGKLVANEMAPRVHNSGHWTIEGAATSQFENHLRAICGLPLGSTKAVADSTMINLIGNIDPAELKAYQQNQQAHVHLYHKEPRAGRKLGHVTV
ncbi:MAG: 5-(carboxyamino)imidazole ribonucleotide synthase, partial [Gammaproteobacteria bacterium]|nr:5-(carboxyamino)imidazole ribonucleotide synthase [Gammaproteobacteria bacterium]